MLTTSAMQGCPATEKIHQMMTEKKTRKTRKEMKKRNWIASQHGFDAAYEIDTLLAAYESCQPSHLYNK
jgi:hypothetical protein